MLMIWIDPLKVRDDLTDPRYTKELIQENVHAWLRDYHLSSYPGMTYSILRQAFIEDYETMQHRTQYTE